MIKNKLGICYRHILHIYYITYYNQLKLKLNITIIIIFLLCFTQRLRNTAYSIILHIL